MGRIFNWLSWQLERRVMMKEMDRLRNDLAETESQLLYARRDLGEVEQLLHEAQSGAKLSAEEQDNLKTQLDMHKSAAAYWESVVKNQQKLIAELRRPANELTCMIETTEPTESELERKAWELWLRGDDSIEGVWRKAELWLHARESKRNGQENQNNGPF